MKIAILGSTGFTGKVLLKRALEKGYQVNVENLVDFMLEQINLETWIKKLL